MNKTKLKIFRNWLKHTKNKKAVHMEWFAYEYPCYFSDKTKFETCRKYMKRTFDLTDTENDFLLNDAPCRHVLIERIDKLICQE